MKNNKSTLISVLVFIAFIIIIGVSAQEDIKKAVNIEAPIN